MPHVSRLRAAGRRAAVTGSASIFAALGDEMRLRLMSWMGTGAPMSIAELTRGAGVTRQAITKHLHVLAEAGLVRGARHGRELLWEPDASRLEEARRALDAISRQWDHTLGRLKAFVERD